MTTALKIVETELDNFVHTLMMDHAEPGSQHLIWNNYQEFRTAYKNIIIEDPKED